MLDLLAELNGTQILIFSIMIILAAKGAWELIDFFKTKYQEKFDKDYSKKSKEEALKEHFKKCTEQRNETIAKYDALSEKIDELSNVIHTKFDELDIRLDQLSANDKYVIKQAIVKDYHYFVEKLGWIDDFSLDTLLLLFDAYKQLGGNSYIASLIEELKKLPRRDPKK